MSVASGLLSVRYEYGTRQDFDRITMMDWLREKKQSHGAIERFWRQVLVSAVNEDLEKMAAVHGLQVFYLGFLANADRLRNGRPRGSAWRVVFGQGWAEYPNVKITRTCDGSKCRRSKATR